jgi:hypothetical protein
MNRSRSPLIMSDAAYEILTSESRSTTGNYYLVRQSWMYYLSICRMMRYC